jgi:Na+-transporting NADH:ubiquinone oxidoreductase subunit A
MRIISSLFNNVHVFNNSKEFHKEIIEMSKNTKKIKLHTTEDKYPAENPGLQYFLLIKDNIEKNLKNYIYTNALTIVEVGFLFLKGQVFTKNFIALSGNALNKNANVIVNKGLQVKQIIESVGFKFQNSYDNRYIEGGLLTGRKIDILDYLTDDDCGLQVIKEDRTRIFLSFLRLGNKNLTLLKTWVSGFFPKTSYSASTNSQGEERACIQCGYCYDVCPIQLMPSLLMKSSIINDIEKMESMQIHHCIECELCTFVCPSKISIGQHIKDGKDFIKKEG